MNFKEFTYTVAERAGLSREEAADLTRATLETLADRLSGGEARDLAVRLPEPMGESLRGKKGMAAGNFGLEEFVRRVSEHAGLTVKETTDGVRAVFRTLAEVVPSDHFDQAMSQLPGDFRRMLEPVS
jgi:uncharacterized protein (DUF2267 family)